MTVEVQTPVGLKSGSSVYEVWASMNTTRSLPEERGRDWGVKGEAVVIELPDGPVFAVLKTRNPLRPDFATMSMGTLDPGFKNDVVEAAGRIGGRWTAAQGDVPRPDWPEFVRFRNIPDPKTVERVDPEAIGVRRIRIETTSDAVTTGIVKRLEWLATHNGALAYDGRMHPDEPEKDLNQRAFISGAR